MGSCDGHTGGGAFSYELYACARVSSNEILPTGSMQQPARASSSRQIEDWAGGERERRREIAREREKNVHKEKEGKRMSDRERARQSERDR